MTGPKQSAVDWNRRGLQSANAGQVAEAIDYFRRAVELDPTLADSHNNLGAVLLSTEQYELAAKYLRAAVRLQPFNVHAHYNLGIASWKAGNTDESITHFAEVTRLEPGTADAHYNLGLLFARKGQFDPAESSFRRAVEIAPGFAAAHFNLGIALAYLRRNDDAIASLSRAVELNPADGAARAERMYLLAGNCDWDSLSADRPFIPELGVSNGVVSPFGMLALEDEPLRHLVRAQRFSAAKFNAVPAAIKNPSARPGKLKIGYFSADFRDHAVMQMAAPLFEAHDRSRFSIHAYSYGQSVDDPMRRRLVEAFDDFIQVEALCDADVAAKARADGVDIAVDLQGNTLHTRLGIFAHRAAPIQVSYLGFPGSTGATFMDYLVTDATVVSREFRAAYLERQLVMPNSYLPSGRRQIASTKWTRELAGLPEDSFVFCCFNNSFKITPLEFDIWMEVLRQVRGSVLWLVGHNPKVERNLRKEADRRGVNPTRLRFAPRVPLDEYLARQQLADLALDTIIYTGHSTASDALWAGVPLITMLGKGFPARVGASLLRAVGLPELITRDAREYLSLALELASDAERLSGIRERLAEQRETAPLFDIDLYARHIEEGFDAAFSRLVRGKPPADIFIATGNNP